MPTDPATEPLIFPIGHYLGPLHLGDGEPAGIHQVRRGPNIDELSQEQFVAWALAQGLAERVGQVPWTRQVVEEVAGQAGLDGARGLVDGLLADGYLVEVDVAALDSAKAFGAGHQLHPLMLGLGNSPEEPWLYGIGFTDQPVLKVTRAVYGIWEWGHRDDNLWQACETFAEVEREAGGTDPELTDPEQVLTGLFTGLHNLTSTSAAYLDVAQARFARL